MEATRQTQPKIDAIFHAALEIADRHERAGYLDSACGTDPGLRQRVESLLEADGAADDFFRTAEVVRGQKLTGIASSPSMAPAEESGTEIGRYKLLQKIGEGGFGTVWMAEQIEPVKRKVALKIIKLGMDTREVIARFEAERQALALMDHPNIAKVLDGGATESGRPFFVMELVRGVPITDYCNEHKLSTQERLELFIDTCHAVQHAHQKGVIHRDLKPSNVMVTMHDDKPVPKVIDFGVAKATRADLTDKTLYTRYEQFIGTPTYMSPEQAQLSGLDIDTRSDIYSLGVLLYELLTGNTPFDSKELLRAGFDEIRRVIREKNPPKPSTRVNALDEEAVTDLARHRKATPGKLESILRGDLDWIIMMALEKDRTRRYDTATGLAMDIQRYLADEPVTAAAPSATYRLAKFVRRNKIAIATAFAITILILAAGVALIWQELDANQTRIALAASEMETRRLEMESEADELWKEKRVLTRRAVSLGKWEVARDYLEELFEDRSHPDYAQTASLDGIRLAALYLRSGDGEAYDSLCKHMIEQFGAGGSPSRQEHTTRAYFSSPRSSQDPQAHHVRSIAYQIKMPNEKWERLCRGIAEFRLGNYAEAGNQLSALTTSNNPKLHATVQPYLAMIAYRAGDTAKAQDFLRLSESLLARMESNEVDKWWHEHVLGRLALEEAKALIGGE